MSADTPVDNPILRLEGITKSYPGVIANQDVTFTVAKGEIHALVGENGAGKSTLLNLLYGLASPNSGRIFLGGTDVTQLLTSPTEAMSLGIGLVSQHFSLIPAFTVHENILLDGERSGLLPFTQTKSHILELCELLKMKDIDLNARVDSLSIAVQQKIGIVKFTL